jgi:L-iditol 2-dehydrogenase
MCGRPSGRCGLWQSRAEVSTVSLPLVQHAAVLYGVGDVRIEERPMPQPAPQDVLIRVGSVGVCGSDVHYFEHGRIGAFVVREPLVLGHEASGVVVAIGDGVVKHRVGERVCVEPGVPCRHCEQCRRGRYNLCPDVRFLATPPVDGAFTEYLVMPQDFVYEVPDSMSMSEAALIEPLSVAIWACRSGDVQPGSRVLVTGAGPIGALVLQVARACGAASVVVTDVDPERLSIARTLGADSVIDARHANVEPLSADVLIECSGAPEAIRGGIEAMRPAGRAVLVGMGADELVLPLAAIQVRELMVTGTFRYANTYPAAIALVCSGRVRFEPIIGSLFSLDRVTDALSEPGRQGGLKPIVVVDQ